MTLLATTHPTLLDLAKLQDPDGSIPEIAEMQNKVNPILMDMPIFPGNQTTGHQGTIRAGLPTSTLRELNVGTLPGKSTHMNVTDTCAILEQFSEIDEEVYNMNGGGPQFRMSEDVAHIEAMAQKVADLVFYGNTTSDPKEFLGLTPRYSDTSADNGANVILAGGADTDNTSIWLINWDRRFLHGIVPRGQTSGLKYENLGLDTKRDSTGRLMRVYVSHFIQKLGIHLKDWASCVRIANLDVSIMEAYKSGAPAAGIDVVNHMIDAWYKIPLRIRNAGRLCFYCNPTVKKTLVKIAMFDRTDNNLYIEQLENGEQMLKFWGIPVKECDALLSTESLVS